MIWFLFIAVIFYDMDINCRNITGPKYVWLEKYKNVPWKKMWAHYLSNLLSRIVTPFFKSGEKYSFEECRISPSNATSLLEVLRGHQIKLIHTTYFDSDFFAVYWKPGKFFNNHSLPLLSNWETISTTYIKFSVWLKWFKLLTEVVVFFWRFLITKWISNS